jgi:hypothetical protein
MNAVYKMFSDCAGKDPGYENTKCENALSQNNSVILNKLRQAVLGSCSEFGVRCNTSIASETPVLRII